MHVSLGIILFRRTPPSTRVSCRKKPSEKKNLEGFSPEVSTHGILIPASLASLYIPLFSEKVKKDCAEYMLSASFAREKGVFWKCETGEDIGKNYFLTAGASKKLREHTAVDVRTEF
jgi:hypothetical protein